MINIRDYYKCNVSKSEYYYRFYDELVTMPEYINKGLEEAFDWVDQDSNKLYEIFDNEDAIRRFRDLCEPNLNIMSDDNKQCFYLLAFYLKHNGYIIEEFPHILERPPIIPTNFTVNDIRNKAIELKLDDNGVVPYKVRRKIVEDFHFLRKCNNMDISDNINELFEKISTRNAGFQEMSDDEKLEGIANLIEHMLYEKSSYKTLDYSKMCFDFIDDDIIKKYRKQIQCFRHAKKAAIEERKMISANQKQFLIEYGIVIVKLIHELLK